MDSIKKLFVIKHTMPRVQYYDISPKINARILNSIRYYAFHELGEDWELVLHDGHEYLVTDHLLIRYPHTMSAQPFKDDMTKDVAIECTGFKVWIGGVGGSGKRDEIRHVLQNIFMEIASEFDFKGEL